MFFYLVLPKLVFRKLCKDFLFYKKYHNTSHCKRHASCSFVFHKVFYRLACCRRCNERLGSFYTAQPPNQYTTKLHSTNRKYRPGFFFRGLSFQRVAKRLIFSYNQDDMRTTLFKKHCTPCKVGTPPLTENQIKGYWEKIPSWRVAEKKMLCKEFKFKDFKGSLNFVKKVAKVAEREGHHPDIYIFYNIVRLELWTHAIRSLSENDFILASKIDKLPR